MKLATDNVTIPVCIQWIGLFCVRYRSLLCQIYVSFVSDATEIYMTDATENAPVPMCIKWKGLFCVRYRYPCAYMQYTFYI